MPSQPVYLDHAASTPVRPEVLEAMLPYLAEVYGNPSSGHQFGRSARVGLEQARREVAGALAVAPDEVFFTSGGTEADNLAILGPCLAAQARGEAVMVGVGATEHKAVLAAAHQVKLSGGEERLLPVNSDGVVDLESLDELLGARPTVVSLMAVNNETGVRHPIEAIAARCAAAGVPLHSDLVQAFGRIPLELDRIPLTFATISGHKLGAPKGVGALIVRDRNRLAPLIHGGAQQRGLRPGTENLAGIVALGRAATLAASELAQEARRLEQLRDELADGLMRAVPEARIMGNAADRAPHILNLAVPGADGEALLRHLDLSGIAASGGSACTTGAIEPSHVLSAMRVPPEVALGAVRFSLGRQSTREDVRRGIAAFPAAVARARGLAMANARTT